MNIIDRLVAAGRDPLEILMVYSAPGIDEWLKEDMLLAKCDEEIRRELQRWTPEMRARLRELIEMQRA